VIDGNAGLSATEAAFVGDGWDMKDGGAGMRNTGSWQTGWRVGLVVAMVGLVAWAFTWQRGTESVEPPDTQPAIADGESRDGSVSDPGGVESTSYAGVDGFPERDGSAVLGGAARNSLGDPVTRPFGQVDSNSVARIPLDGGGSATDRRQLGAIPQNEPEPYAGPPSFDVSNGAAPAPIANGADDEFPSNDQRLARNGEGPEFSTRRDPLQGDGVTGPPAFDSRSNYTPENGRDLQWVPAASPAVERTPFAADGGSVAARDFEARVGTGTRPRSFDASGTAQPIGAGGRSSLGLGQGGLQPKDPVPAVHAVQSGDSYWTISRRHYGTARYFQALAEYNRRRIPDPRLMRPGMKVLIPSRQLLETRYAGLLPREVAAAGGPAQTVGFQIDANGDPVYSVGPDDTLTDIARLHLGRRSRWIQIFRMNRDQLPSPHKLKPGTVLRMPADATRLQLAPDVGPRR